MPDLPTELPTTPMPLLAAWVAAAQAAASVPNPDAMTLATSTPNGQPSARVVLCKALVQDPGYLVFYTNYQSAKGAALAANPAVAATFHWDVMNRQVRIEGLAIRSPAAESDAYFASRDRASQLGAWASDQSRPIDAAEQLQQALAAATARHADNPVPRPAHWGGYRVWISAVELWARGAARLHDRGRWTRELAQQSATEVTPMSAWQVMRLQP
jgi:pyridoxamine 5'-phosphate oxidase